MEDNNIKSTTRLYHTCKDKFRISKAVSLKLSNPLSKICQKCYNKCNKKISKKKTTDLVYDRMKEQLFLYLMNNIPLQSIEFDKVQYYDYVKNKKK